MFPYFVSYLSLTTLIKMTQDLCWAYVGFLLFLACMFGQSSANCDLPSAYVRLVFPDCVPGADIQNEANNTLLVPQTFPEQGMYWTLRVQLSHFLPFLTSVVFYLDVDVLV